jgi:hypothetical protein
METDKSQHLPVVLATWTPGKLIVFPSDSEDENQKN